MTAASVLTTADRLAALEVCPAAADADTTSPGERPVVATLPPELWQERPVLGHIRQAAHSSIVAADAVLGAVLARLAASVPPALRLPPVVGSAAPLNLCVANIGPSGAGKTQAANVAGRLLPITSDDVKAIPLGSGEGIVAAYLGQVDEIDAAGKTRKTTRQVHRGVLVLLDEGQVLAELAGRRGATLLPTIRTAWSGAELGQHNADADRRRLVPAGEYAFALLAGFQPDKGVALLDDADGGTPQRFLYLSALDPQLPADPPADPGPLAWSAPPHRAGEPMEVDPTVVAEIRGHAAAKVRGEITDDPLDSHRHLLRLKVAGLLALLDHRTNLTADDWTLAGLIVDTSDGVRSTITFTATTKARIAEQRAIDRQVARAGAVDDDATRRALEAMVRAIARHVHRGRCTGGCRRRCVARATASRDRALTSIDDAFAEAEARRFIELAGDEVRPGPEHLA